MLARFQLLVKNDFRESHVSLFYVLSYFISTLVTLSVFWFTSKAFAGSVEHQIQNFNTGYFDFIVVGELIFLLPTLYYSGPLSLVKRWLHQNTFESFIMMGRSPLKELWVQVNASLPQQLLFMVIYLTTAHIVFNWSLAPRALLLLFAINVFILPLFFALGLIMISIFLLTGRGSSLISQMVTFIAIFSGAYFPMTVMPEAVLSALKSLSPFYSLVENSRLIAAGHETEVSWALFILFQSLWSLALLFIGTFLFNHALKTIRLRGSYFPKTRSLI